MPYDERSTRQLGSPRHSPSRTGGFHPVSSNEKLADVATILDEIEGIVSGIEPSNPPKSTDSPEEPERAAPAAEASPSIPEPLEFSIERLEAELEDAIATELGGEPHAAKDATPTVVLTPTEPTPEPSPTEKPSEGADVIELPPEEFEQPSGEVTPGHRLGSHHLLAMVFCPCAAPIERLSARDRLLVNVVVLSLVFWVPIVWFLAS